MNCLQVLRFQSYGNVLHCPPAVFVYLENLSVRMGGGGVPESLGAMTRPPNTNILCQRTVSRLQSSEISVYFLAQLLLLYLQLLS